MEKAAITGQPFLLLELTSCHLVEFSFGRVAKCHGYDGYIHLKILVG